MHALSWANARMPSPSCVLTHAHPTPSRMQVCAVSLVGQWIAEAQAKLTPGRLRIHMYHGGWVGTPGQSRPGSKRFPMLPVYAARAWF